MNYFKTGILKKEFKTFLEEILPAVSKCGLCEKLSCKHHKKFLLTCSQCRDICCSNCIQFKYTFTLLLKSAEEEAKNYLQNFVTDYFNLSEITLEKNF